MTLQANQVRRTVGAAFALLLGLLGGCGEASETPLASQELLEMRSDMVGYDTNTYVTVDGVRSAQIHSDTTFYFEDSTVVHMDGVRMEVFTDQGAVRATVTAARGRYDPDTQGMYASGNVVLVMAAEGKRVESSELWYEPVDERIWSDSASTYYHDGQVTRGTCFKSDLSFRNYTVCNIRGAADVGGS